MQCYSPSSIPRPHGAGALDRVIIPCGICYACLSKKRSQWAFRIEQEFKKSRSAFFVTLTYDEDHINYTDSGTTLNKRDIQLFMKKLRQSNDLPMKYFLVGEYGTNTNRPHYHAILFNVINSQDITKFWENGFAHIGTVTGNSIMYTAKYCITKINNSVERRQKPFMLVSKGMGISYVDNMKKYHNENGIYYAINSQGKKVSMPRYYRDKIFTKQALITNKIKERTYAEKLKKEIEDKFIERGESYQINEFEKSKQYVESVKNRLNKSDKI